MLFRSDHRVRIYEQNYDASQSDKMQRSLIYVSLTRAMDFLNVFTLDNPTAEPIIDLKNILENKE